MFKGLFDRFKRRQRPTTHVGTIGTRILQGYIQNGERNAELVGQRRYLTFSELLVNTSIVGAGVRYFLNLTAKSEWHFEPPVKMRDSAEAREMADLTHEILHDMETPWHRVIRRAAMYKFYGFSIQAWTAKMREDGVIGFLDIEPRPQHTITRWDVTPAGQVHGVVQHSPLDEQDYYLPRSRLVYAVDDALSDSPEGVGLLRHIVPACRTLQRFEQLEGIGFDSDLRGIPIGRAPLEEMRDMLEDEDKNVDEAELNARLAPIESFMGNHVKSANLGLLLDSAVYESAGENPTPSNVHKWAIELLKSTNSTQPEVNQAIRRLNYEIARVLGVQMLLLGEEKGTQALSRDQSYNFAMTIDGTLMELKSVMQRDVLRTLWDLNGWDPKLMPLVKTDPVRFRDVTEITGALKDMTLAAPDPRDPAHVDVRAILGITNMPEDLVKDLSEAAATARAAAQAGLTAAGKGTGGEKKSEDKV